VVPMGRKAEVMIPYHMLRRGKVPTAKNTQRLHYRDLSDSETEDNDTSPAPVQKARKLRPVTEDLPHDPPSRATGPARDSGPASRPPPNFVPVAAGARPVTMIGARERITPLVTPVLAVIRAPDSKFCFSWIW
jgi:hypothetical protein